MGKEAHGKVNIAFNGFWDYYPIDRHEICISNGKQEMAVRFENEAKMESWSRKLTAEVCKLLKNDDAARKRFIDAQQNRIRQSKTEISTAIFMNEEQTARAEKWIELCNARIKTAESM